MGLCFCNSIADWLNRMRARGTFKPRIPIRIGSGLAQVGGYGDFFLIGRATLPAGIPRASAFLRPSLPLRACPGFSLVLTRKTIALARRTFVGKVISLLFNMLSRLLIAFLPRSKLFFHLFNFMAAVTIYSDFGARPPYKVLSVSIVSPSICHE